MTISRRDEVIAVFGEADRLDFGADFVRGHFGTVSPIPHVDDHVVLGTHGHDVFVVRCEGLEKSVKRNWKVQKRKNIRQVIKF